MVSVSTGQGSGLNVAHHGGGGAPTTIVFGSFRFDRAASLRPIAELLTSFMSD
jgi:hypothetical protein